MFIDDMADIDYEILDFINDRGSAGIDEIKQKFPNVDSLEYRVRTLATSEYSGFPRTPTPNTAVLFEDYENHKDDGAITKVKYLGIFRITTLGKKVLQDQKVRSKRQNKELWLKNAWIPILVSTATTLIINGIGWLFPLIKQWITSTLS